MRVIAESESARSQPLFRCINEGTSEQFPGDNSFVNVCYQTGSGPVASGQGRIIALLIRAEKTRADPGQIDPGLRSEFNNPFT